jgi:hypothetical protein
MSQYLKDPEYLFSLLVALVKKSGGHITITEEELQNVSKGDFIGMYYEPTTGNVVIKEIEQEDALQASKLSQVKKDEVYEN